MADPDVERWDHEGRAASAVFGAGAVRIDLEVVAPFTLHKTVVGESRLLWLGGNVHNWMNLSPRGVGGVFNFFDSTFSYSTIAGNSDHSSSKRC